MLIVFNAFDEAGLQDEDSLIVARITTFTVVICRIRKSVWQSRAGNLRNGLANKETQP